MNAIAHEKKPITERLERCRNFLRSKHCYQRLQAVAKEAGVSYSWIHRLDHDKMDPQHMSLRTLSILEQYIDEVTAKSKSK